MEAEGRLSAHQRTGAQSDETGSGQVNEVKHLKDIAWTSKM